MNDTGSSSRRQVDKWIALTHHVDQSLCQKILSENGRPSALYDTIFDKR